MQASLRHGTREGVSSASRLSLGPFVRRWQPYGGRERRDSLASSAGAVASDEAKRAASAWYGTRLAASWRKGRRSDILYERASRWTKVEEGDERGRSFSERGACRAVAEISGRKSPIR